MSEAKETVPADWLTHPHTMRVVRKFKDELSQAHLDLMRHAHTSDDPGVRGEAVRVEQLERFLAQLTGQVGNGGMQ